MFCDERNVEGLVDQKSMLPTSGYGASRTSLPISIDDHNPCTRNHHGKQSNVLFGIAATCIVHRSNSNIVFATLDLPLHWERLLLSP